MVFNPGEDVLGRRAKFFRDARTWGISLVTSLIGIRYIVEIIKNTDSFFSSIFNILFLALFSLTMILIFLWIWATSNEIDIFIKWLHPTAAYQPPNTILQLIMILSEACLLAALAYASRNPLYYGIVFSIYSFVVLLLEIYLKKKLKVLFAKNNANLTKELELQPDNKELRIYREVASILEFHYLKRPTTVRHFLILIFCLIGVAFSIMWNRGQTLLYGLIAFLIYFVTITVSEFVINYWRYKRDMDIRIYEEQIAELQET